MSIEDKLDLIIENQNNQSELLNMFINTLTTKKAVAGFLNKSEKTIDNYIKNYTFLENKHYIYNEKGKIEYLPLGIIEFKRNPKFMLVVEEKTEKEIIKVSEISTRILKGVI